MVVESPREDEYDLYLEKNDTRTCICGPYWSSLVRVYDIQQGDLVSFVYDDEAELFDVTVNIIENNLKVEKPMVGDAGIILVFLFLLLHLYTAYA